MHGKLENITYGVITVSDSRFNGLISGKEIKDESGNFLRSQLNAKYYSVIPDNKDILKGLLDHLIEFTDVDCIVITGGTGLSPRDNTPDILEKIFQKKLPGFEVIFHNLSYKEVGYKTILSRATAGIYGNKIIYALPGSLNACKTAVEIIKKETGHILKHILEGRDGK